MLGTMESEEFFPVQNDFMITNNSDVENFNNIKKQLNDTVETTSQIVDKVVGKVSNTSELISNNVGNAVEDVNNFVATRAAGVGEYVKTNTGGKEDFSVEEVKTTVANVTDNFDFWVLIIPVLLTFGVMYIKYNLIVISPVYFHIGMIVLFAILNYNLSKQHQGSFNKQLNWVDALYLSVVSHTTVGYGDIVPQTKNAKILNVIHLLTTFMYVF